MYTDQRANPTPDFTPHCTPKLAESEVKHVVDAPANSPPASPASSTGRVSTADHILARLHPSLRATFIPLPSDPAIKLTDDQRVALFAGADNSTLRDLARLIRERGQDVA